MQRQPITTVPTPGKRPALRLATERGRRLHQLEIAPIDSPELPMTIRFEGITPAQQRAALAAFPGGRRFILLS